MSFSETFQEQLGRLNVHVDKYAGIIDSYLSVPFEPVYKLNSQLASLLAMPKENTLYLIVLFIPFLLSFIYRGIPRKWVTFKHLFNIFFGLFLVGLMFGSGITVPVVTTVMSFLLMKILPLRMNRGVTAVLVFLLCSVTQIHALATHYLVWRASFTSSQMLLTFKLVSLPFNLYDGKRLKKHGREELKKLLLKEHLDFAVKKKPSFLQYFSYAFHYGTIITGPVYEYVHFINWIENKKKIPFDLKSTFVRFFWAMVFLSIFVVSGMYGISSDDFTSLEYLQSKSRFYILMYTNLVLLCIRTKYLFAWFFGEAICVASGFGLSKKNEDGSWEWANVQQTDLVNFYFATSARDCLNSWNMGTSRWLRYYVYERVPFRSRTTRQMLAMCVSALWHGFYPGYYFTWVTLTILIQVFIGFYQKIRPKFLRLTGGNKAPLWMTPLLVVLVRTLGNHVTVPFHVMAFSYTVQFFNHFYWSIHIGILLVFLALQCIPRPPKKKKK